MPEKPTLQFIIQTPHKTIFEKPIEQLLFTTSEGQMVVRPKHENAIYHLLAGEIIIKENNKNLSYLSTGGMLTVNKESLIFITPLAAPKDEFENEKNAYLRKLSKRYSEELKSEADLQRVQMALQRSLSQK